MMNVIMATLVCVKRRKRSYVFYSTVGIAVRQYNLFFCRLPRMRNVQPSNLFVLFNFMIVATGFTYLVLWHASWFKI